MKRIHLLTVRGERHEWSFPIVADPRHADEWRRGGIDIVRLENSIPEWVADVGLTRIWCAFQDIEAWFDVPFSRPRWWFIILAGLALLSTAL